MCTVPCTVGTAELEILKSIVERNDPEFHFWGLNICVDFYLRDSKKNGEYEETK